VISVALLHSCHPNTLPKQVNQRAPNRCLQSDHVPEHNGTKAAYHSWMGEMMTAGAGGLTVNQTKHRMHHAGAVVWVTITLPAILRSSAVPRK
jgi:hypothetical protein